MVFVPVLLRILILHIILAIRWMLIKILSGVISVETIIWKLFFFFVPLFQHMFYLMNQLFLVGHIQHILGRKDVV